MINTFFHIATIGRYQEIVDEILSYAFVGDRPYIKENKLSLCISGPEPLLIPAHPNIQVIDQTDSLEVREFFTLRHLEVYCDSKQYDFVGFIHSKGVTSDPNNQAIKDWRAMMMYWILEKWEDGLAKLKEGWDAYGCDLRSYPCWHFSGTCWLARCGYIRTLPRINEINSSNWRSFQNPECILSERHGAEFWIGYSKTNKLYECYSCGIDQFSRHLHKHPRELYVK